MVGDSNLRDSTTFFEFDPHLLKNEPDYNGEDCRKGGNMNIMVNKASEFKSGPVIVGDNDAKNPSIETIQQNCPDLEKAVWPTQIKLTWHTKRLRFA